MKTFLFCMAILGILEIGRQLGYLTISSYPRNTQHSRAEDVIQVLVWAIISFFAFKYAL